nr:hypothetical protein [Noviherbaspirillum sp. Root189]
METFETYCTKHGLAGRRNEEFDRSCYVYVLVWQATVLEQCQNSGQIVGCSQS